MKIEKTTNYAQFTAHANQQPMSAGHVKRLMQSMKKNGFVEAKPIHCYRDGKRLIVIDGHHRLAAASTLGIPVAYVVGTKDESGFIADSNFAVRKWSIESFVRLFASKGNPDYVTILKYSDMGIGISFAACLLSGELTLSGNQTQKVMAGTWKLKTESTIRQIVDCANQLKHIAPAIWNSKTLHALAILVNLPKFDVATFIARVDANPRAIVKVATREQAIEMIDEIYNFRARNKVDLVFSANQYVNSRKKCIAGN
jgi:hypothetical protein